VNPLIYVIISVRFNAAPYFQLKKNLFSYLISDRFLNNAGKSGAPFIEMFLPPMKYPPWKDPPVIPTLTPIPQKKKITPENTCILPNNQYNM
jgi:hypothetical protein